MKRIFLPLLTFILVTNVFAQKPEKQKYNGYFSNIPSRNLQIDGYKMEYNVPNSVMDLMTKDTLNLQLKGYNEGNDLTFVFYCSEPTLKAFVEDETKKVNDKQVTQYYSIITAESDNRLVILNKDKVPVEIIDIEPDLRWVNKKGFDRSKYSEAEADLKRAQNTNNDEVIKRYIKALIKAYQYELDNRYSKFTRNETMRVFTIKEKSFDYSDFNAATQSFIELTSNADLNSPTNIAKIKSVIDIWQKYESEYQSGKKNKVSDVNIDEIYFNISMGYLVLGQGEELKNYWNKCLSLKGNYTAEGYARNYLPLMIDNYDTYLAKKDEEFKPLDLITPIQKYNDMILLKTFLNFYFTEKQGNLGVIMNYFPSQPQFIKKIKTIKDDGGTVETIEQTYSCYGKLKRMTYSVEGSIEDDITRDLSFSYIGDKISNVYMNGNAKLFHINYDDNEKITNIEHIFKNDRKIVYNFENTEPGKTELRVSYIDGEKTEENKHVNWVKYDVNYNVTGVYMAPYVTRQINYDTNYNIIELNAINLGDNTVTIPISITTDDKGNATISEFNGMKTTNSYEYIY